MSNDNPNQANPQYCGKKLGQPSPQGMHVCGEPVEYLTAEQAKAEDLDRVRAVHYSGYRHVSRKLDADHWPVPKSWLS